MVLWVKHWNRMKNKTLLFLAVACPMLMWGQVDTLWTADIIGQVSKGSEYRTSADSLATDVESASDYLQKDSRFNLKQYTPGSVVASSFGGASSEQSRVLWDGIDISSMATGVLDLSLVPAMMLSTTSIVDGINGGASSSMGSMGALDLNLSPKTGRGTTTTVGLTSIGERALNAHSWGSFSKIRYQSIVRFTSSDNEYDYRLGALEGRMVGNGYGDLTYLQRFSGAMGKTYWSSDLWYTQSEKNNSGSILSPGYINHLEDEVVRFKYKLKRGHNEMKLFASQEWQAYTDTMSSWTLRDTNTFGQFTALYTRTEKHYHAHLSLNRYTAGGTNRTATVWMPQVQLNLKPNQDWNAVLKAAQYHDQVYWSAYALYSRSKKPWLQQWSVGSYYRLPTLNEMYWNPGGNVGVSAERSYGAKYSLEHEGTWTIRFTSDQLYYDQMIQWAPGSDGNWTPQNYYSVYTSTTYLGVQRKIWHQQHAFNTTHQYSRILDVASNNANIIGKQLIYRPALQAVYTIEQELPVGTLMLRGYYTGLRHTLRDNARTGELPAQSWVDLAYSLSSKRKRWQWVFRIENITGAQRQFYQYYPMPGRTYLLNIKLHS